MKFFFGVVVFFLFVGGCKSHKWVCPKSCRYDIVESIPTNITLDNFGWMSTYEAYIEVINSAKKNLRFAEFYWSLGNRADPHAEGHYGNQTVDAILAAHDRGVFVEVVYSKPAPGFLDTEIPIFKKHGIPCIEFDFEKLFGGVFHTKFMIADENAFYLGAANTDWRSLRQVKEIGLLVRDCPCLSKDILLMYDNYKYYQTHGKVNNTYDTDINIDDPIQVPFIGDDQNGTWFLGSSPAPVNTKHRTDDIKALTAIIGRAQEYCYIEVMKFLPTDFYTEENKYWAELDTAIKSALFRGVNLKLIIADWNHTLPIQIDYMYSLYYAHEMCQKTYKCKGSLMQKLMHIPDDPNFSPQYPFTRVNHAKFVVTERDYGILNSNFAQDYFYSTSGITIYGTHKGIRSKLNSVFWRDWDSKYSKDIRDYPPSPSQGSQKWFAQKEKKQMDNPRAPYEL